MEPPAAELRADSCIPPHGSDCFENSLASDSVVKTGVSIDIKEEKEEGARPPAEDRAWKRKAGEQEAGRVGKAGRFQESKEVGEDKDAVKQLKNISREFKAQKEAEAKRVKALVKNIQMNHQKQLADMKEINTAEVDALNSKITEKDACIKKEKNTVKQLKNINKKIKEPKGIAEKEMKVLEVENKKMEEELAKRPTEGGGGGESQQEERLWSWRSSSSSNSKLEELLEESKDRVGALEAETEQLKAENTEIKETKKELEAENMKIRETIAVKEERAKQVLKNAREKIKKSEDEKKELEDETELLKAELKEEKAKQINQKFEIEKTTKLVAELQEKVECPVCLVVPREGPVPCCPVGHIICSPCLGKLRAEGRGECPTCKVPMGEGKSALAKHIIENMDHQCRHQGCDEMAPFGDEAHQVACEHRLVICPGPVNGCQAMVPFCKVKDHAEACLRIFENKKFKQGQIFSLPETQIGTDWNSQIFSAENGDTFFLRMSRTDKQFSVEVVMLGTQEACEGYTMEVAVVNPDTRKVAFSARFKPRPIVSTNVTDEFCLTIKQESLAKIWRFNKELKSFEFIISTKINP